MDSITTSTPVRIVHEDPSSSFGYEQHISGRLQNVVPEDLRALKGIKRHSRAFEGIREHLRAFERSNAFS